MHKVLLAVDGSTASDEAARLIAHLPHPDRLDLLVLSVVQRPFVQGRIALNKFLQEAFEQEKAAAATICQQVSGMFDGANATVRCKVTEGNAGNAIVETATEMGADLVVVGAVGKSQISRILLGSVSDHVATHAQCSVLVVRPTGLSHSNKPIRVCLGYEGSSPARAAIDEVSEILWRTGTDFHVLTVAPQLHVVFADIGEETQSSRQYIADLREAKTQLAEVAPEAIPHLIQSDHVGDGIVNFAEANEIDLLVVGETPRDALNRFVMGSTSRYVLRHAPCSVWITRREWLSQH